MVGVFVAANQNRLSAMQVMPNSCHLEGENKKFLITIASCSRRLSHLPCGVELKEPLRG